jgi:integrase
VTVVAVRFVERALEHGVGEREELLFRARAERFQGEPALIGHREVDLKRSQFREGLAFGDSHLIEVDVRHAIRTRHYSSRTEEAYVHWIRRYIVFHEKKHPSTLGAADISRFLTWLAIARRVSASTQNQALSAVLFLYKAVLAIEVGDVPPVVRARTPERLPVVLSRDEIGAILQQLVGTERLMVLLLYGSGLRLDECLELRVKDLDFDRRQIVVRQGKGQKDRDDVGRGGRGGLEGAPRRCAPAS